MNPIWFVCLIPWVFVLIEIIGEINIPVKNVAYVKIKEIQAYKTAAEDREKILIDSAKSEIEQDPFPFKEIMFKPEKNPFPFKIIYASHGNLICKKCHKEQSMELGVYCLGTLCRGKMYMAIKTQSPPKPQH